MSILFALEVLILIPNCFQAPLQTRSRGDGMSPCKPISKMLIQALRSFWINLPIGSVAFLIIAVFFSAPRRASTLTFREKLGNLDFFGALFFIGATVCLLLALQWGGSTFPWKDSQVWGLFIGVALLVPIFVWIQIKRGKRATIPPSIIKQRTVIVCTIYSLLYSMVVYT